jgi:hypothetical protein
MYLEYTWFRGLDWISVTQETSFRLLVNTGKHFFVSWEVTVFLISWLNCSEGRLLLIYLLPLYLIFLFMIPEIQEFWRRKALVMINPSNAELNPICHLLALLGAHHILHVSRIRVNLLLWSEMCYVFVWVSGSSWLCNLTSL